MPGPHELRLIGTGYLRKIRSRSGSYKAMNVDVLLARPGILRVLVSAACVAAGLTGGSSVLAGTRTIDGAGNHPLDLGAADTQLRRAAAAAYPGDGSGSTIIESPARANPRDISNTIFTQSGSITNDRHLTNFVWQWGQFLDHDIDLTNANAANGTANIPITSPGDPLGPDPIPFVRSNYDPTTGTVAGNPRQQINEITAFIDGSNVYGSDDSRAAWLRTGTGGKLRTSTNNLLPFNDGSQANAGGSGTDLFVAGDVRSNEQVGLTAMHTLFVREHNRLADLIALSNPLATDEGIYQTTRKIVGAEIQAITYNEFLPALLGPSAPDAAGYLYSESVDPSISNEFATAAYRFGHSMLSGNLNLVDDADTLQGQLPLRDAFFNPDFLTSDASNLGLLLKGLASTRAQEIDAKVVDDVRDFLFGPPGAGGLDLASLNIQRGRDHGLPDYNTLRGAYGLSMVDSFDDITSDISLQSLLQSLYGGVENIDAWVGALAEDHLFESSVGELVDAILTDQFIRLRDGDRFFFSGDSDLYTPAIQSIIDVDTITLADVILLNTDVTQIQSNVFLVPLPAAVWSGLTLLVAIGVAGIPMRARHKRRFAID